MRYRELKVGMLITGKPNNGYAITSQYSICRVVGIGELEDEIKVAVVDSKDHPDKVGTKWHVDYKRFVKYEGQDVYGDKVEIEVKNNKPEVKRKFKMGDYVIGNDKSPYSVTKKGVVCYVTKSNGVYFYVKLVNMKNGICYDIEFPVDEEFFDYYDFKKYNGLFASAFYGKNFTINDGIVIVNGVGKDSPCYKQLIDECVANGLIKKGE